MSLRGTWRKATSLPNGVGESKVYSIDFILIVSLFSLFRRRFQTDGHLVVPSTPISPAIEPFSAESNRNRVRFRDFRDEAIFRFLFLMSTIDLRWISVFEYEQKWLSLNTPKPSGSSKRKAGETCSQTSSTTVGDHEIRPEGIKAAKAKRNNSQGKSLAEYTSIWEMKKEDLMMKEKMSKLAILDTLLAKKEPLSLVKMDRQYSYSQPSDSEEYGGEIADSGYSSMKELIRRDQAELSINYGAPAQYPPQPEMIIVLELVKEWMIIVLEFGKEVDDHFNA
ncbi:hypothetical protein F2Q69_00050270 [Brassica cretica]|uniref:No apical meristem-associated C-terminal domain-containing protein n=1 Tax=Brassica cretica TaxID=69181 RepID=A0A8S9PT70_BRACR|nr:hypothetical protein F2Q69_00050270 [Brassica cretica]